MLVRSNTQEIKPRDRIKSGRWLRLLSRLRLRCLQFVLRWCATEVCQEVYRGMLQRVPDPEGLATNRKQLALHGDLAGMLKSFLSSDELQRKMFVSRAPELVKALYRGLLGREPDAEGEELYTAFLAETQDLSGFVAEMADSVEFRKRNFSRLAPDLVRSLYEGLLGRDPVDGDLAAQTSHLGQISDLSLILKQLVGSREFHESYSNRKLIPDLVNAVYLGLLGREPDAEGEELSTTFLAETQNLSGFVAEMADSAEFKKRNLIQWAPELLKSVHQGILGRDAVDSDLAAQTLRLRKLSDLSPILNELVDSQEFYQSYSRRKVIPELVKSLYRELLGCELGPEKERAYTAELASTQDWASFLSALSNSTQCRKQELIRLAPDLVKSAYRGIFGREADSKSLEVYARLIANETGLEMMLKNLIESAEFRQKNGKRDFIEQGLDEPLTPAVVRAGFWLILGRACAEKDVNSHLQLKEVGTLRLALLRSAEFRSRATALVSNSPPRQGDAGATKTIFLHIPKTGGTTLHEALTPFFEANRTCPERFDRLHGYTSGDLARYRFFSGHFSLDSCELIPGPKRIVTMLRNPVDRLVSLYNFSRAHSAEVVERRRLWLSGLARRNSMREFFAVEEVRRHPSINNAVVRALSAPRSIDRWETAAEAGCFQPAMSLLKTAKQNLRWLTTFGILEHYQESAELIFDALGLPMPARIKAKMVLKEVAGKTEGIEPIEPQQCDPETLKLIAPLVKADMALYNYGLRLFKKNIKTLRNRGTRLAGTRAFSTVPRKARRRFAKTNAA